MLGLSVAAGHGLCGPLYRDDQIPDCYRENYIIRGYRRPRSSIRQCLLSLFDATNETLNFWTHFLPFLYFVWLIFHLSYTQDFWSDSFFWPLLCHLLTCCAFPLVSAVAHLFNILSDSARHVCFFMDYAAISLYSCGSAIVYRAYSFPSFLLLNQGYFLWYRDTFVYVSVFNAIACTSIACYSRMMKPSPLRVCLRLFPFGVAYLYDTIPILLRLFLCQQTDECQLSGNYFHFRQFFFATLAVFLYGSHLPERVLPGIFDIVGHSHQLFHVFTILGASDQVRAVIFDAQERHDFLWMHWPYHSQYSSLYFLGFVFVINSIIVAAFPLFIFKILQTKAKAAKS